MIQQKIDSGVIKTPSVTEDSDLEKTTLIKPLGDKGKISMPDAEEDLSETMIMKPKPGKTK
jgi:hypothetical protein